MQLREKRRGILAMSDPRVNTLERGPKCAEILASAVGLNAPGGQRVCLVYHLSIVSNQAPARLYRDQSTPAYIRRNTHTLLNTIMPLSQQQMDQYNENGFLPMEGVLTPLEVKALHMRLEDIGNEVVDFPKAHVQIEPLVKSGELPEDPVRFNNVRKIWSLTRCDELFKTYARHPKILDVVTSLLGPNIKIFVDQTLCKPPRVGSPKPPHQDSAYWTRIDPPSLVICWMSLNDATEDNGCMRFIPGSHKQGVIEHKHLEDFRVEDENVDYENEVSVPLMAGDCSFHHSLSLHRTGANRSDHRRIGLTVAYMSAESKYIGEGEKPDYDLVAGKEFEGCV